MIFSSLAAIRECATPCRGVPRAASDRVADHARLSAVYCLNERRSQIPTVACHIVKSERICRVGSDRRGISAFGTDGGIEIGLQEVAFCCSAAVVCPVGDTAVFTDADAFTERLRRALEVPLYICDNVRAAVFTKEL